ncbi:glycosyltransferase family 4 protein [Cryobacterium sp. Y50]|uniref:glycosyltransferase family 4 protein n=1 Tax=Cryobacterium sp. Y50 TaxID=2048286 RepID=UPI0011B04AA1|nr:glycosyltransferase family 4 protein [Cryobacterium sp. Y50]
MNLQPKVVDAMKTVWMINHYAALPSKDGWTGRHQALAAALPESGWQGVIVAASTGHPVGRQQMRGWRMRKLGSDFGVLHLMIRATAYQGNGFARILNIFSFSLLALWPGMLRGLPAPDVIIGSTVHPLAAWAGKRLARRYRVPFVFEIRDVWPDALVHLGQLGENGVPARAMRKLMVGVARDADLVLAPLPGIDRYLKEIGLGDKPFLWVSNGIAGDQTLPLVNRSAGEPFTFMYLGSHGNANALDRILAAFDSFTQSHPDLDCRLRLVGDGPKKQEVMSQAATLASHDRIHFSSRVPRDEVLNLASEADCLVVYLHDHDVYKYGISPNKVFDYLLSARPVIFATTAMNNPVSEAKAGITVSADSVAGVAAAMSKMILTPQATRIAWGENGRRHVLENYTYSSLAAKLARGLDGVVAGSRSNVREQ